ncbi:MAG TPA: manganese catalase family protein [Alphaproteobacteria bacterium]|nr:manganese catalase family protein [Alphaproteobacteria bacterium]
MFFHTKHLQYNALPERPDPVYAKKLQEILGGQWGEMSVMISYLFQGWNCRGPIKYRDMILDIGTEEIAHVEMIATMIARLLEESPVEAQEDAAKNSLVGTIMGGGRVEDVILSGMNPQHAIVSGGGATPTDSVGYPWNARYTIASGNLLADFRYNVTAESQGRLQVTRLYALTEDPGVRNMLSFLIARDTMHQNQWLAAIEELEKDGLGRTPVPHTFPQDHELSEVAYQFMNCSEGTESQQGRWASGPSMDGKREFQYVADPKPMGPVPELGQVDPRLHGTPKQPVPPST